MPDRLAELVRQRALVQEHLAWLDREIAAASASSASPPPKSPAPTRLPATTPLSSAPASAAAARTSPISPADAEKLLEEYRVEPAAVKSDVRKGCLLYFAAAFVLLALGVTALYFLISRR